MFLRNEQLRFITTPLSSVLVEAISGSSLVGDGIETYPLDDYILHSIFLKMTGAQEQKMKCIVWEMASNDYEYRYLKMQNKFGEYSCYDDKNKVYKDLLGQISKIDQITCIDDVCDADEILNGVKQLMDDLFKNSSIKKIHERQYKEYRGIIGRFSKECFMLYDKKDSSKLCLFKECFKNSKKKNCSCVCNKNLIGIYDSVYRHRNRCAHNTLSYQQNYPTLAILEHSDYKYENIFLRFAVLLLIDEVFIRLFCKYQKALKNKV